MIALHLGPLPPHVTAVFVTDRIPVRCPQTQVEAAVRMHVGGAAHPGTYPLTVTARCDDSVFSAEASQTAVVLGVP
jgi:hypothetical protein